MAADDDKPNKVRFLDMSRPENLRPGPWHQDPQDPGPSAGDDYFVADVVTETTVTRRRKVIPIQRVPLSDDHIAFEFINREEHYVRFDHNRGKWFIWSDTYWQADEIGEVLHRIREFCAKHAPLADTDAKQRALASAKTTANVETFARRDPRVAVRSSDWDRDPFLMATPGGTVDLRTGLMREARPDDMISRTTAVAPVPAADCPTWLRFLDESCAQDANQISFIRKLCGYCLTGDTREQVLIFVYGPGGNGKGVFLNSLTGILHQYAGTAGMETFTRSLHEQHSTEIAMLDGPRLITSSETEEGKRWAEARIKALTGGDPITARFMRQDNFTFRPRFKLIIIGNHMPALGSVDDAMRRRFRLIPFNNKPAKVDYQLEEKLKAEWPGILRWMIDGCIQWQMDGLAAPEAIKTATDRYFEDQDVLKQWLEERCERADHMVEDSVLAFADWQRFAEQNNEYVGTKKTLTARLQKVGIECQQKWHDGGKRRCYFGMRLKFGQL